MVRMVKGAKPPSSAKIKSGAKSLKKRFSPKPRPRTRPSPGSVKMPSGKGPRGIFGGKPRGGRRALGMPLGRPDPRVTTFKPGSRPGRRNPKGGVRGMIGKVKPRRFGARPRRRALGRRMGGPAGAPAKGKRNPLRGLY